MRNLATRSKRRNNEGVEFSWSIREANYPCVALSCCQLVDSAGLGFDWPDSRILVEVERGAGSVMAVGFLDALALFHDLYFLVLWNENVGSISTLAY